ncbi:hypothetical protein Golob_011892 [Gossypium lobatum]|uniref:Uncharacterized protein n=1 Tax=Gossypium lobatum TaxID=34289 RepID=A0A7J8MR61_9ROSI|nr:hypothetical protein [Gossypium lobatum]
MPGAYPIPYMYPNPYMFPFPSPMPNGLHEAPSRSSSYYQSLSPYEIQTPLPWVMQTSPYSLFYQGGSSS